MVKELKLVFLGLGCFVLGCIGLYWVVWYYGLIIVTIFYFTHLESTLAHIMCIHTLTLVIYTVYVFTHSFLLIHGTVNLLYAQYVCEFNYSLCTQCIWDVTI